MNKIAIIGHENPDIDSVISGSLLADFLKFKGYNARYVIPGKKVDESVVSILKSYDIDVDKFSKEILDGDKLILVDHHETKLNNEILAVIDHHPTIKEFDYPIYINKKASSTTKHIYDIVENEYPEYITKTFVELVLLGMVIDTLSFKSSKALPNDEKWFFDMCNKYSLDENKILKDGYGLTSLKDKNKVVLNDFKSYDYFGYTVNSSAIKVYEKNEKEISLMLDLLKEKIEKDSVFMWVFIVVDLKDSSTVVYKIYASDRTEIDSYDFIASRSLNIMPKIEKNLKYITK